MLFKKDQPGRRKFQVGAALRRDRLDLIDERPELGEIPWHDPLDDHFVNQALPEGALIERDWQLKKRRLKSTASPCAMLALGGTLHRPIWLPAFTIDQTKWSLSRDPKILQARFDEGDQLSRHELRLLFESNIGL